MCQVYTLLPTASNGGMDRDWEEMEDFTSDDEGEFEGFDNPSASGKTNFPVSMIMVNLVIFLVFLMFKLIFLGC